MLAQYLTVPKDNSGNAVNRVAEPWRTPITIASTPTSAGTARVAMAPAFDTHFPVLNPVMLSSAAIHSAATVTARTSG